MILLYYSMQARPLFKDRRKFPKMADPLLQGQHPMRGLYQALAVAAMCLQEQATTRPLIGDVVTALSYLASHSYDPNTPATQSGRVGPSTPRSRDERRTHGSGSDSKSATDSPHRDSPKLRLRDSIKAMNSGADFGRGDADGSSGRKWGAEEFERQDSHRDSPNHLVRSRDSPKALNRDVDRERAIAEAKVWGENWRERKRANAPKSFDSTNE